ncbi:MAG: hypothetical protein WKF30_02925 [Pyrinomonadaceae bacterium]
MLDETVLRFAASPAFKNAAVLDVNSGEQARQDLELILALSQHLKERIPALGKPTKINSISFNCRKICGKLTCL